MSKSKKKDMDDSNTDIDSSTIIDGFCDLFNN